MYDPNPGEFGGDVSRGSAILDRCGSTCLDRRALEETSSQKTQQLDVLVVLRPEYRFAIEGLDYSFCIADNIEQGRVMLYSSEYAAVITDDPAIAGRAAEKGIASINIDRQISVIQQSIACRRVGSICLDLSRISSSAIPEKINSAMENIIRLYKTAKKQPKSPGEASQKYRVLVADDEKTQLLLYKLVLEEEGYEVVTANTSDEAYSIIKKGGIDCLVTDYLFDKKSSIDGLQLLERVKANYPQIPVIIRSGSDLKELKPEAEKYGARCIPKASDTGMLADAVKDALTAQQIPMEAGLSTTPFSDGTIDELLQGLPEHARQSIKTTINFEAEFARAQKESSGNLYL